MTARPIKALFFDLDGTLLDSEKKITAATRATLSRCKARGIRLFVATARPPRLKRMLSLPDDDLALFEGGVYLGGGLICIQNRCEYFPLRRQTVSYCIEQALRWPDCNIALQMENEIHAFRYPLDARGLRAWGVTPEEALSIQARGNSPAVKVLVFWGNLVDPAPRVPEALHRAILDGVSDSAAVYLTDSGRAIHVIAKDADKRAGVDRIRRELGLAADQIAVFGDDTPDIELLRAYPNSFAMGNAPDAVRAAARYVTLDNDSDGVGHAIEQILKLI